MKSLNDLKYFYETNMVNKLKVLDEDRKKIVRKVIFLHFGCSLGILLSLILFPVIFIGSFLLIVGIVILWIFMYKKITKNYVSDFKREVIHEVIKFIDPGLSYQPDMCIPQSQYMGSKIFQRHPDRYRGDDLVYGTLGKTQVQFSEIHSEYKTETRDSKGHRRTQWHTIFKGIFFVADFNKNFHGRTLVLPDKAQSFFGKIFGNWLQSLNFTRDQLVKMEDPEFERKFVVYSTDQIEARYILSTALMKRITDFQTRTRRQIYLSFINSQVFVAISIRKDLFEPKLFQTLLNFNIIKEYFNDLNLAISVVESLNLNTRIWGSKAQ